MVLFVLFCLFFFDVCLLAWFLLIYFEPFFFFCVCVFFFRVCRVDDGPMVDGSF